MSGVMTVRFKIELVCDVTNKLGIMKLENLIILQNNVDLLKEAQALAHQKSIAAFVKDTISVQLKYNTDAVNEYIVKRIPIATSRFSAASFLCMPRTITCSLQFQEG